jgi:hypothetical protein
LSNTPYIPPSENIEYYRTINLTSRLNIEQLRNASILIGLRDEVGEKLKAVDRKVLNVLRTLYEKQDRMEGLDDLLPENPSDGGIRSEDKDLYLAYTPLHKAIMSREFIGTEENQPFVNHGDLLDWTPLHYAVNIPGWDGREIIKYASSYCRLLDGKKC